MNVIKNFTKRNLSRNRRRTIVTIIGVMLSTALICTVVGMAATFRASVIEDYKLSVGNYHDQFYDVPAKISHLITENAHAELVGILSNQGFEEVLDDDRTRNYINISGANDTLFTQMNIQVTEGRLPENEHELVIPKIYAELESAPKVGDEVTITLGERHLISDGSLVKPKDGEYEQEYLEKRDQKKYKVVGIVEDLSNVDGYSSPAYLCLFRQDTFNDREMDIFIRYDMPSEIMDIRANLMLQLASEGYTNLPNSNMLAMYEGGISDRTSKMILGLGLVICLIIIGTSVFVIANSFRISVEDKKVQFGMLASVGATKRQIRNIVLREGAYIFAIGTAAGIALGAFVIWVLDQVVNLLLADMMKMKMIYTLPWWVVASTILMSAVTIYFASIIPAHAAMKITPIDIIRGRTHVKLYENKLHASARTKKLFGVGGVIAKKNLQRTRKKYRTTVVSLVIGMAVFIGINSFVGYGKRLVGEVYTEMNYNIEVSEGDLPAKVKADFEKIRSLPGIRKSLYTMEVKGALSADRYMADPQAGDFYNTNDEDDSASAYLLIEILPDRDFKNYLHDLGEKADSADVAVLGDHSLHYDADGTVHHKKATTLEDGDTFDFKYTAEYKTYWDEVNQYDVEENVYADGHVKLLRVTDEASELPFGFEKLQKQGGLILFVSERFFEGKTAEIAPGNLYLDAEDADEIEQTIKKMKENGETSELSVYNEEAEAGASRRLILVVEIFLYGFIIVIVLIGVTNVFNTITTNMNLRQREFAMLRSVGMTRKEFYRMIRVEGAMYAFRSIVIGIPLGILLSYLIYHMIKRNYDYGYVFPYKAILIAILAVVLIVGFCMWSAVRRQAKMNIIATIRRQTY
ncbi:MAG: ABC transporter permease [Eubacterium sp.]|nr:ABC transporter permease [Eubacterium sp.]